jgi:hypothetical protein
MAPDAVIANHHHDHPGFSGLTGLAAALSMIGRGGDARLAARLGARRPDDDHRVSADRVRLRRQLLLLV